MWEGGVNAVYEYPSHSSIPTWTNERGTDNRRPSLCLSIHAYFYLCSPLRNRDEVHRMGTGMGRVAFLWAPRGNITQLRNTLEWSAKEIDITKLYIARGGPTLLPWYLRTGNFKKANEWKSETAALD